MCGICGIVYQERDHKVDEQVLTAMRDVMLKRGPDDAGTYVAPGIGLGSRRLAILDLTQQGHMPMSTPDGRYWITYNGEIYNFRELRAELEDRGCVFRSLTDTEVALYLYEHEGPAMLSRLNGMFAIAIWDAQDRTLFLARDRLGVKPLYYHQHDGAFYFASEEKAFFAAGVRPSFDQQTWEELLCFRYVAGEQTPFLGIKRLLPGHYLLWKDGQTQTNRWWNLSQSAKELRENLPADPIEWYKNTFDDAVRLRLISDVPVGLLLSGGLDSSSIAASLGSQGISPISCFTVGFAESAYDETPLAQQVAEKWNFDCHNISLSSEELVSRLQRTAWLNDEPLVHANELHLWAISEYAKPRVSVLLSGEGADETLNGYVRYQPLRYPALLNGGRTLLPWLTSAFNLNGRFSKLSRFLTLGSMKQFLLFNSCDLLPTDLEELGMAPSRKFIFREQVLSEAGELYPNDLVRQAMYSDQHTFLCSILDRNDRMVMGASIECRVPFLDYRLVEILAALPSSLLLQGTRSKSLLRKAVGQRLPQNVMRHRKWGFGVPWQRYLREIPLFCELVRTLPDRDPIREGPIERETLRRLVDEFLAGDDRWFALIKELFVIAVWYQTFFELPIDVQPA
jgi:asparagine synthase (glutamine-hydrolysing)